MRAQTMELFKKFNTLLDSSPAMLEEFISAMGNKTELYAQNLTGSLTDGMPKELLSLFDGIDEFFQKAAPKNDFPEHWISYFDAISKRLAALRCEIEKEIPYKSLYEDFKNDEDNHPTLYTRGGEILPRGYFFPGEKTLNAKRGKKCRKSAIEKGFYNYKYQLRNDKPIRAQKFENENSRISLISDEFIFPLSERRTLGITYQEIPTGNEWGMLPDMLSLCQYDDSGKIVRYIYCHGFRDSDCSITYVEYLREGESVTSFAMQADLCHGFGKTKNKIYRLSKII